LGSDVLGRVFRLQSLYDAAWWTLTYAAAITPITIIARFLWKQSINDAALPPGVIQIHQWFGICLAIAFMALAMWRWNIRTLKRSPGVAYLCVAFLLVLALAYQGSLGGQMVLGS
jgi:uncharacterized membrane protein